MSTNLGRVSKTIPWVSFMQISGNFFGESHTGPFAKIALTFQPCDTYVLFIGALSQN